MHYGRGRIPAALDAAEEAWKLAKLTDNPLIQAEISLDLCKILFSTNGAAIAWKYIEIALMNAFYTGNRLVIARALDYMGYGYLRRGDYQNAYRAYEAAAESYFDTVDAHVAEVCKENMGRIVQKEDNPNMVVGFYRPAIDMNRTLFYPSVQAPV